MQSCRTSVRFASHIHDDIILCLAWATFTFHLQSGPLIVPSRIHVQYTQYIHTYMLVFAFAKSRSTVSMVREAMIDPKETSLHPFHMHRQVLIADGGNREHCYDWQLAANERSFTGVELLCLYLKHASSAGPANPRSSWPG